MIAYDKRFYHDRQMELFSDPEWEDAEKSEEKPQYYRQITKTGIVVRRYKPSIAELVMKRTGFILEPWKGGDS